MNLALTIAALFGASLFLLGLWHFAIWAVHLPVCGG